MKARLNKGWVYQNQILRRDNGKSLLSFFSENYPHSSGEEWQERISSGQILLNSELATPERILKIGDKIEYHRSPWLENAVPDNFNILWEDEHLVVVSKPAGLPVMPAGNFLINTLQYFLKEMIGSAVTPIHRLGRGTSGIVLFAKNKAAEKFLFNEMRQRKMKKVYRALVQGCPENDEFVIRQQIGKIKYPLIGEIYAAADNGVRAESRCKVIRANIEKNHSIIEVDLITGRPHQIRIHLAFVGHSLIGDPLYKSGGIPLNTNGQSKPVLPGDCGYYLHAGEIQFIHPDSMERIKIHSPYPAVLSPNTFRK